MIQLFLIIVLIFSAVIHEYMHGFAAYQQGDDTAKRMGRLTINPLPHLDLWGSIILPGILIMSGLNFVIAWAKPVPYNPNNLRDKRFGEAKIALAGPLANFALALSLALITRFIPGLSPSFLSFIDLAIFVNLLLMVFNLLPFPPLDGSKVLGCLLSPSTKEKYYRLSSYGLIFVLTIVFFFPEIILYPVYFLHHLLVA